MEGLNTSLWQSSEETLDYFFLSVFVCSSVS